MVNPQYEIRYSDEKVTAWGGMRLMKEVLERGGASGLLGALALPQPGSSSDCLPLQPLCQYALISPWDQF